MGRGEIIQTGNDHMDATATSNWKEANQRYLSAALAIVRNALERHIARLRGASEPEEQQHESRRALEIAASAMPAPAALTELCEAFDLSPFERDVLLLCSGIELDSTFASLCAAAHGYQANERGGAGGGYTNIFCPTFSL